MSLVFNMCGPAFRFDIHRATVAATISHTIKGIAKHEDKYLIALNDESWNLYAAWVSHNKYSPPAKLNATGTYPAAGIAVGSDIVYIPISDKDGGALYKNRYLVQLESSKFINPSQGGFTYTTLANVRLNRIINGMNALMYGAGKRVDKPIVAYANYPAVGIQLQGWGLTGEESVDISMCRDADTNIKVAIVTDKGRVQITSANEDGPLQSDAILVSATNSEKLVMLPGDSVTKYRCAYAQKTETGYRLVSRYGDGTEVISPDFAAQGCTIIGAGRIGKTAAIVYSDEQKNGRVYVNTDGVNGRSYPLDIADPAAMCPTDTGIAVIGKIGAGSHTVVEVNPL